MKLSDAIMLNGMTKPQGFGSKSMYSTDAPCALGGALQAIGKQNTVVPYSVFKFEWPWTETLSSCPVCSGSDGGTVTLAIAHLNDKHRWTRKQIAEWVARIEPQESEPTAEIQTEETVCVAQK